MMRSLYAGVSGLQNHQIRMDVIGNNISNVNTHGFKKGRVNFQDMLSQSLSGAAKPTDNKGGVNPKQVGLGMMVATIDTIHTQGSSQTTGNKLDLAIQGNGFFILKDGDKSFYTRAGAFNLDKDGLMVNPGTGLRVQGWMSREENGVEVLRTSGDVEDIKIPLYSKDPARATQNVDYKCNLKSDVPIVENFEAYDNLTVQEQNQNTWQNSINIFDNFGNPLEVRFTYIKTGPNQWRGRSEVYQVDPQNPTQKTLLPADQYNIDVNPTEGEGAATANGQNEFDLTFNNLGRILSVGDQNADVSNQGVLQMVLNLNIPAANPDEEDNQTMAVNINVGNSGEVKDENGTGITQFSSGFSTKAYRQDGFAMGYMEDIKVDDSGTITGVYSNGNNRVLAQVALANFTNPGGLEKAGETNFVYSNNSGEPDVSPAGTVGKGKIIAGALEMSNVDLSEQFVDMIVTQRGFQANSKTIQTTDQMLQELMTLKR